MTQEFDPENPSSEGTSEEAATALEPGSEPEEDSAAINDLAARLEQITVERDRLAAEREEIEHRLLRRQADFENFRRRMEKDRAEFAQYAGMETVRALLPVLDDFERALKAVPHDSDAVNEYVKGVEMIYQRLADTLRSLGLEPIESVGKSFDPNIHHAVERVPTEDAEDQTVLEEWRKGYNFKGKLLREAMVRVAVKPS